jgi:hypothetical protein
MVSNLAKPGPCPQQSSPLTAAFSPRSKNMPCDVRKLDVTCVPQWQPCVQAHCAANCFSTQTWSVPFTASDLAAFTITLGCRRGLARGMMAPHSSVGDPGA